jgi:hypothetical protein
MQQPNLKSKCIICGTADNLYTTMKVKIDVSDIEVVLCDSCSDETTPRMARDAAKKKLDEYNDLLSKMREFGVNIVDETKTGIIIAEEIKQPVDEEVIDVVQRPSSGFRPAPPQEPKPARRENIKPKITQPKVNFDDSLSGENIQVQNAFDPGAVVKRAIQESKDRGKIHKDTDINISVTDNIEPQVIDHGGVPMAIPKRIHSTDGSVTDITIVTTTDAEIQRRAKDLDRNKDNPNVHGFSKGYNLSDCTLCRGKGRLKANNQVCPKCKGNGYI